LLIVQLFFYPSKNYLRSYLKILKGKILKSIIRSQGLKWGNKLPSRKKVYSRLDFKGYRTLADFLSADKKSSLVG